MHAYSWCLLSKDAVGFEQLLGKGVALHEGSLGMRVIKTFQPQPRVYNLARAFIPARSKGQLVLF